MPDNPQVFLHNYRHGHIRWFHHNRHPHGIHLSSFLGSHTLFRRCFSDIITVGVILTASCVVTFFVISADPFFLCIFQITLRLRPYIIAIFVVFALACVISFLIITACPGFFGILILILFLLQCYGLGIIILHFSAWKFLFSGNQRKNGKYPGHFVFQILVLSKLDRNISVNQADLPVISEFNMIRNLVIF